MFKLQIMKHSKTFILWNKIWNIPCYYYLWVAAGCRAPYSTFDWPPLKTKTTFSLNLLLIEHYNISNVKGTTLA